MKDIRELRNYLLENCVDRYGDLVLRDLDLSDFDGNVIISGMKVRGSLVQSGHVVHGDLYQGNQVVHGSLFQSDHYVKGSLHQRSHEVQNNLIHGNSVYGGELVEHSYRKMLKEVTMEELAELGYKIKEEK